MVQMLAIGLGVSIGGSLVQVFEGQLGSAPLGFKLSFVCMGVFTLLSAGGFPPSRFGAVQPASASAAPHDETVKPVTARGAQSAYAIGPDLHSFLFRSLIVEYRKFGNTGLTVSRLTLGTMTFGLQTEEDMPRSIMDRAVNAGVNFIDTANVYPLGSSHDLAGRTEEIVGRWLKGRRDRYIVSTKAVHEMGPLAWRRVAQASARCHRCIAHAFGHRLRRSVSVA